MTEAKRFDREVTEVNFVPIDEALMARVAEHTGLPIERVRRYVADPSDQDDHLLRAFLFFGMGPLHKTFGSFMNALPIIPPEHVEAVCRPGTPGCCAYLMSRHLPDMQCAKLDADILRAIRERLAAGTMGAKGDNCSGPPDYRVSGP